VLGSLAGGLATALSPWQLAVLAGWDVAAAAFLTWVWLGVGRFTPEETGAFATREDDSRVATSIMLLSASVASLGGGAGEPNKVICGATSALSGTNASGSVSSDSRRSGRSKSPSTASTPERSISSRPAGECASARVGTPCCG